MLSFNGLILLIWKTEAEIFDKEHFENAKLRSLVSANIGEAPATEDKESER